MDDDDDVFLLKSDSEPEQTEKHNENIDQNKKNTPTVPPTTKDSKKKKHHKKHHHHHHHHHSKSKEKSKKSKNSKEKDKKDETINNTLKEDEDNFIVDFKFELSDSVELSNEKNQQKNPPESNDPPNNEDDKTPKQSNLNETPKTEIKASSIPITDVLPIENKSLNNNNNNQNITPKPITNRYYFDDIFYNQREVLPIKKPKKIRLTTNRNSTYSLFEYRILCSLDQSLNHLSQEFLEDFQYYVENAFSYEKIFDDFLLSLNSEIHNILHKKKDFEEFEVRLTDNISNITESITNDIPTMPKINNDMPISENESIDTDLIHIHEDLMSAHQIFVEIQSERSNCNEHEENEVEIQYDRLKKVELERIELEAASKIQQERMRHIEERLQEFQGKNDIFINNKIKSKFESNSDQSLKNSLEDLINDLQRINRKEDKGIKLPNSFEYKKKFNDYTSNIDQISYEIDYLGKMVEKSFCPLFAQITKQNSSCEHYQHRNETIISE